MLLGIALSVLASLLFGGLYYYAVVLHPLQGPAIFGWRIVLGFPLITLGIMLAARWPLVRSLLQRMAREPKLLAGLVVTAHLMAMQMVLFMWAPLNGHGLPTTLGYFLMPLAMVLVGKVVYHEELSRLQWLAVLLAAVGVGHALVRGGDLSWSTAVVVIGYPVYFMVRRALGVPALASFWVETLCMLPLAVWLLADQPIAQQLAERPMLWALLPLLGLMSALAVGSYLAASTRLPMGLFGLLGYVEPALLFIVSLLIGEHFSSSALFTYGPIALALLALGLDGLRRSQRRAA